MYYPDGVIDIELDVINHVMFLAGSTSKFIALQCSDFQGYFTSLIMPQCHFIEVINLVFK